VSAEFAAFLAMQEIPSRDIHNCLEEDLSGALWTLKEKAQLSVLFSISTVV
jgi:hypothetical protein